MCRSIRTLFNYEPPASDDEIQAASLQYVRKVSGYRTPSRVNREAFDQAVDEIAQATRTLIDSMQTQSPPRSRADEAAKAQARSARRFGSA